MLCTIITFICKFTMCWSSSLVTILGFARVCPSLYCVGCVLSFWFLEIAIKMFPMRFITRNFEKYWSCPCVFLPCAQQFTLIIACLLMIWCEVHPFEKRLRNVFIGQCSCDLNMKLTERRRAPFYFPYQVIFFIDIFASRTLRSSKWLISMVCSALSSPSITFLFVLRVGHEKTIKNDNNDGRITE